MPATSLRSIFQTAAARIARDGFRPRGTHNARAVLAYATRRTGTVPCIGCGAALPVAGIPSAALHGPDCPTLAPVPARPVPGAALMIRGYHSGATVRTFQGRADSIFPRYVGVEIESILPRAGGPGEARMVDAARTWGPTNDCSIAAIHARGERACEWVSPPMRGAYAADQITAMSRALVAGGARVDRSTGLHVHVDVRDLDDAQFYGVARVAWHLEAALYSIITPSRARTRGQSGYSVPSQCPVPRSTRMAGNDYSIGLRCADYTDRYNGLNLSNRGPGCKGTIEFRYHHGTMDHKKIIPWARIMTAIVEYGRTHGVDAVCDLPASPWEALAVVLAAHPDLMDWATARREAMRVAVATGVAA